MLSLAAIFFLSQVGAGQVSVLDKAGFTGGLIVHLGCGNGRLTAALGEGGTHLVHGLNRNPDHAREARRHIQSLGL